MAISSSTVMRMVIVAVLVSSAMAWDWPWETIDSSSDDFMSKEYQRQSKETKMNLLWKKITEDQEPNGWPWPTTIAGIFLESMDVTFDWAADILCWDRKKLIHSAQGAVAKVQWVSTGDHPYTGIFKGSQESFMRFSIATERSKDSDPNWKVGAGIKHVRSGVKSCNWVNMYALTGQNSANFFKNSWSNHVQWGCKEADVPTPLKLLAKKFSTASAHPQYVGLSDCATYDTDGKKENSPRFPFQLFLQPTDDVKTKQSDTFPDRSDDGARKHFSVFPSGTHLYDVMALDSPGAPKVKIAEICTTTQFVTSKWGDKNLFIQHQRMEDDLKLRPEWTPHTGTIEYYDQPPLPFNGAAVVESSSPSTSSGVSAGVAVAVGVAAVVVSALVAGLFVFLRRSNKEVAVVDAAVPLNV